MEVTLLLYECKCSLRTGIAFHYRNVACCHFLLKVQSFFSKLRVMAYYTVTACPKLSYQGDNIFLK